MPNKKEALIETWSSSEIKKGKKLKYFLIMT
jgi:hypothetical protein